MPPPSPLLPADFAAEHGIVCDTEKIGIDYVNTAMERLVKNDVHYRWVYNFTGRGQTFWILRRAGSCHKLH